MVKALRLSGELQTRLLIFLITAVVLACYLPTLNNGFVWDDNANFIQNINYRGLSLSHLYWMFTTFNDANYHPLTWLSLGFDFVLWGMNPAGYHLTNILLHVVNTIFFYFLIMAFLGRTAAFQSAGLIAAQVGAVFGTLFFAVHPLRVETVSWISTRGDLLCGGFYILTIIAYLRMNDKKAADGRGKWFLLSLFFFMGSLLSRAWGITMPFVLLILDIYPLRRFDFGNGSIVSCKRLLAEKTPYILLAFGAGVLAFWAKRGSMLMMTEHGIIDRFLQATYGLCFYVFKTMAPIRLSPFYLFGKDFNFLAPIYFLSAVSVFGITLCLIVMRHRWPWILTGWACYAVVVSPLLGFVQSGPQIAADRYTYIACMPYGILAGAGVYRLWIEWQGKKLFAAMTVIWVALLVLSVMSFRQTRIWYDNRTFLDHVLKLDPGNYIASYDRGLLREKQGDLVGALADYTNVIRLDPEHAKAYNNRGVIRDRQGDRAGALADFKTAIRLAPFSPEAYANLGMIRLSQNDIQRAVQDFSKALEVASVKWPHREQVEQQLNYLHRRLDPP